MLLIRVIDEITFFFLHLFALHYNVVVLCSPGDLNFVPFLFTVQPLTIELKLIGMKELS